MKVILALEKAVLLNPPFLRPHPTSSQFQRVEATWFWTNMQLGSGGIWLIGG